MEPKIKEVEKIDSHYFFTSIILSGIFDIIRQLYTLFSSRSCTSCERKSTDVLSFVDVIQIK